MNGAGVNVGLKSIRTSLVVASLFAALGASPALASTHVWQGPPSGGLWSTAANWTNGLPTTGEPGGTVVEFGGSTSTTMNIAGLTVDQLHFTGTGNTILASGSTPLGVSGSVLLTNILDGAGGNTVAAPITLSGALVFATVTTGTLTLSGAVGGADGLKVTGSGAGGVTLTANNTYTGTTTVAAGTLGLNSNGLNTAVVDPLIVVGLSSGSPATLKLLQSSEIGDSTDIQIAATGTFDVNSSSESVHGLATADGATAIGTGSLSVSGPLSMTGGTITGTSPGLLRLLADVSATSSATAGATISAPVALDGARTFTVADGPQPVDLSIANSIGDGTTPSSLTKAGAGAMSITGTSGNTYTGDTIVQTGTLATAHSIGVGIPASVTIGTGTGGPSSATLRLDQSSELSSTASVTVQQDGLFNLNSFTQTVGALTVHGGAVAIGGGNLTAGGTVAMTGGTIDSTTGRLFLGGDVSATSSAQGTATISAHVVLTGDRTFNVTPGTAPELTLSGVVGEQGGARALTKAGGGTLLSTADHTYTGLTTVAGGRFVARGQQPGPFVVGAGGTLTGNGAVGATTVTGALAPEHGLRTGALSFAAGGQLVISLTSADPALAPTTTVTGGVTIDPAAVLTAAVAPGLTLPGGSALPLLANDGGDAITGAFGAAPISSPEGVPLVPTYNAVDGNDFALTASNVAPIVGALNVSRTTGAVGQAFALSVGSRDLNNDTLTTTWDFGDGTHGTGASTSHVYAIAGIHHVVATVSDGTAQTTATTDITVTQPAGGGLTGSGHVSAAGFGAMFTLTAPRACVRPGATFTATLVVKHVKGKKYLIATVNRVVFSAGGKATKTDRSAPFGVSLKLPAATRAGAGKNVAASAHLKLRNGTRATKILRLEVRVCG
jgi:autotransporter-associated beta strand protein